MELKPSATVCALAGCLVGHLLPALLPVHLARSAWCWASDGAGVAVPLPGSPFQDGTHKYFADFMNGCCQEGSNIADYYCYSKGQCKNGAPSREDALKDVSGRRQSCEAVPTTNGTGMLGDYCPVSDVTQHARVALDVAAMTSELDKDSPDFAAAKAIYLNGQNSQTSSGGLRTVQGMAERDLTGEPFFDAFALFYAATTYQKDFLMDAFDGIGKFLGKSNAIRSVALKKGLLAVGLMYAAHELESAMLKGADGLTTDDGAPHAWDEAWAFFYGVDGTSSSHEVSVKRDKDFGGVDVAPAVVPLFNQGQHALRASTYNAASAQAAATAIYDAVAITYLRAAIKYSYKMQTKYSEEYHAEAYTYWRTIAGWAGSKSLANAGVIEEALSLKPQADVASDVHCVVKAAVEAIAQEMGYDCATMGMWYSIADMTAAGCPACSFSGTAVDIPSGKAQPAGSCVIQEWFGDYCSVSDVTQHARVALDIAAMTSELDKDIPNFVAAKAIYLNGQNSQTSSGGLRTVQGMAERDLTGEPFFDAFSSFYAVTTYQKDFMMDAFDGIGKFFGKSNAIRSVALKKGLLAVGLMYAAHELESAIGKGADGLTTDDGAPHAWDEAWAFFYGVDGTSSSYEVSVKRDKDFGGVDVAPALVPLFNQGQHALRASTYNAASARAAATAIYDAVAITYLRAAIKYSYKMQTKYSEEYHAEAYTYWRTIAGWAGNKSLAHAGVIEQALALKPQADVASDVHCVVKAAVEAVAQEMGYDCATVGMWYSIADMTAAGCRACSFSGTAVNIPSGKAQPADKCMVVQDWWHPATQPATGPTPASFFLP